MLANRRGLPLPETLNGAILASRAPGIRDRLQVGSGGQKMNLPEFTAEASLGPAKGTYRGNTGLENQR